MEEKSQIEALILKATNSTSPIIDSKLLSAIKSAAKSSDKEIHVASETLLSNLHKPHSQIRYLSLHVIDELFLRSSLFRSLWAPQLQTFFTLTLGYRRNSPLPPPEAIAKKLKQETVEVVNSWNTKFGKFYRELRLGVDYMKNILRVQLPESNTRERERDAVTKQILKDKFEFLKCNYDGIRMEVRECVDEIKECLEIISVKEDEDENEQFGISELDMIRLEAVKEGKRVKESCENKAVFDTIRELYKVLVSKHLKEIAEWISVMVRVDLEDYRFRDVALKDFIDLRNLVTVVKKRCERLGCDLSNSDDGDDDDIWEEGKIETYVGNDERSVVSSDVRGKNLTDVEHNINTCSSSNSDPLRSKLLLEAPVLTWGSSLDNWGSTRDVLANQRGLELDGHWGRVDPDATIPKEKIDELKLHCSVYKEESSEIQPCLAPLKKGGLCQRKDLRICPFHGPIVPRDPNGNPIEQFVETETHKKEEFSIGKGKEVVEELAKQAIKNVRERESEIKAMKRAKRERVREHNEAVLREAAMASASYSGAFVENVDGRFESRNNIKEKKATLASMLKKKVTTKDRLAKRLLNARSRDASSKQVVLGEDSKYREAFPNQW